MLQILHFQLSVLSFHQQQYKHAKVVYFLYFCVIGCVCKRKININTTTYLHLELLMQDLKFHR
jgi:hypothetical protein